MTTAREPRCGGNHDRDEYGVVGEARTAAVARAENEARQVRVVCADGVSLPGKLGVAAGTVLLHVNGGRVFASEIFPGV